MIETTVNHTQSNSYTRQITNSKIKLSNQIKKLLQKKKRRREKRRKGNESEPFAKGGIRWYRCATRIIGTTRSRNNGSDSLCLHTENKININSKVLKSL
jgi:hypothetical protein